MTTALQVADYIKQSGVFGEMQLQKLLYYSQAWSLAWFGRPLFSDEIEAWRDGPVVHKVWASGRGGDVPRESSQDGLTSNERAIIDAVYDCYGVHGGQVLSQRTHQEQPWVEARNGLGPRVSSRRPLSQSTMRSFFTEVALLGEGPVPTPPVLRSAPQPEDVDEAFASQKVRWRGALQELARQ